MDEMENTVAAAQESAAEAPADDAQGTAEIDVTELVGSLMGGKQETVDEGGDDGQSDAQEEQPQEQETGDKFSRRIAAALRSQERSIIAELGGGKLTRQEIAGIIREHQARAMHEEDPEISEKAARRIIEAEAGKPKGDATVEAISAQMRGMIEDGWTTQEMQALVADEAVQADIADGKTLRQAARAYERRQHDAQQTQRKRAVKTARSTAAGESPEPDPIRAIPDDRFDAFMEDLRRRAMRGEKVKI